MGRTETLSGAAVTVRGVRGTLALGPPTSPLAHPSTPTPACSHTRLRLGAGGGGGAPAGERRGKGLDRAEEPRGPGVWPAALLSGCAWGRGFGRQGPGRAGSESEKAENLCPGATLSTPTAACDLLPCLDSACSCPGSVSTVPAVAQGLSCSPGLQGGNRQCTHPQGRLGHEDGTRVPWGNDSRPAALGRVSVTW